MSSVTNMDEFATPKGSFMLVGEITDRDVTIFHRDPLHKINRQVYNQQNAGQKFKAAQSRSELIIPNIQSGL